MFGVTYEIAENIRQLYKELDWNLSQNYVSFDICFADKVYSFHPPSCPEELEKFAQQRREIIHMIIADALKALVDKGINDPSDHDHAEVWSRVLQFIIPAADRVTSPLSASAYADIKIEAAEKAKSINFETYIGVMERSDLTEEERDAKLIEIVHGE